MWLVLNRWFGDRRGQDLVEYAMLGTAIAFAGLLAMSVMDDAINVVYTSWDAATQEIWEPEDPQ